MGYLAVEPITWEQMGCFTQLAASPHCGALVTFLGIVRADSDGTRKVQALHYEAYHEMAERQLYRWIQAAKMRWSLHDIVVRHRLGRVDVGEVSVALVVTAAHRAEAYAASQFLMARIKEDVPIWKHTVYDDGTSTWDHCGHDGEEDRTHVHGWSPRATGSAADADDWHGHRQRGRRRGNVSWEFQG